MISALVLPRAEAGGSDILFRERFESFEAGETWEDGSVHGRWIAEYNGYGTNGIVDEGSKHLAQVPMVSTKADETHACLVLTKRRFGDLDLRLRMKTVESVRVPEPNPWETAWVIWNHEDDVHFYYLALKPNGWELGKEDPAYPGAQRFLATGGAPTFPIGSWHDVRIVQRGAEISAWANGEKLVTFTDRERPYLAGRVGLYNEDAEVRFDDIVVRRP